MKNIIKVLLVVMALVLVIAAFTACEPQQPEQTQPENPTPEVCTHENIEFVLGTEPTCTEDGLTSGFKCKDCGEWTVAQEVDPAGHDYTVKVEVDATCTEAGYTEMKCARCDATTDHKVIEPYGHELVDMKGKAATCTEDGYSDYKACKYCDHVEGVTVIPAGHELIDVEGKAPTCTEEGYSNHKACKNCDYIEGKTAIPAAHNYVDGVCGTCKGVVTYFVNVGKWANVYAHMWNASGDITSWPGVKMTKTGETVNGYDVYKIESAKVPANIIFNNNSGAQTADLAFVGGKYFSMLNATWYDSYEDVPKFTTTAYYLPGSFNSWNQTGNQFVKEGTSTVIRSYISLPANKTYEFKVKNGSSWYGYTGTYTATTASPFTLSASNGNNVKITTKCAGIYVFEFDTKTNKLTVIYPHTVVVLEGKDATCTEDGLTEGKKCSACNTILVKQEVIPAGHKLGEDGVCTVCGETLVGTLEELVAALANGGKITLTADITASDILVIGKPTVLNGNGHTITSSAARAINISGADGVTIKNLTVVASGERAFNVIQNATNVVIENVTATAANYTVNAATSAPNAVVTVKNSTLTGLNVVNIAAPNAVVTVTDSKITCDDQTEVESYAALVLNKDAEGASIVATNVELVINGDSTKAKNSTVNGTITIDGSDEEVKSLVAYIPYGDYYYGFETLAGAIEKATEGETIILLRDIELDADTTIVINKAITIDLNGHTITGVSDQTGSNRNMFSSEKGGNLTVKNGTITLEHKGDNMGWGASTNLFNVTGGAVLTLEKVTAKNLGGSDMAFVAHLNNWGEVTLNVTDCVLESTYVAVRVFNSGYDMNNVTIMTSTLKGVSAAFWVHNYTVADFGTEEKVEAQKALLNFDIEGNENTLVRDGDVEGPVRLGFTNSYRLDGEFNCLHTVCTEVVTAPTCAAAGYTTYTCDYCGHSYTEAGEAATGVHTDKDANYRCDVCECYLLPEVGTSFKLQLVQATLKKTLYFTGNMNGYYYETSEAISAAKDLYLEEVDGGYHMYFLNGEAKNYLYVVASGTYINVKIGTTPSGVWTWNEQFGMFVTKINGTDYYIGTYNSFNTISASKTSFVNSGNVNVSQFIARPYVVPAHECDYTEATCTALSTCKICGVSTGELLPHDYTVKATCTANAKCGICGTEKEDSVLGHTTDNGTCERCGKELGEGVAPVEVKVSKSAADLMGLAGLATTNGTNVNNKEINLDDNISIICSQAKSGTAPSYYSPAIRLYQKGATLTVKGTGMKTIIITCNSSDGDGPISVVGGTASALTSMKYTITVNADVDEVVITTTGTDKNSRVYVSNIEVVYEN